MEWIAIAALAVMALVEGVRSRERDRVLTDHVTRREQLIFGRLEPLRQDGVEYEGGVAPSNVWHELEGCRRHTRQLDQRLSDHTRLTRERIDAEEQQRAELARRED